MSLIELGKKAHLRAAGWLCPQRIVFHHVPKCGGTSVGRALRRAYILSQGTVTPEQSLAAFNAVAGHPGRHKSVGDPLELREMMLLYLLYSDVRCVSAHVPFSDVAFEKFSDRYRFVTLLRDPVERFVSHYMWSHKRPGAHGHIPEDFEDFLVSDRAAALGQSYVRYFCGQPGLVRGSLAASVEAAIANLGRLDLVGFLDDVRSFESGLQRITAKSIRIGRENVGKSKPLRERVNEGRLRQLVLDACAADREVWAAVQELRGARPAGAVRPEPVPPARADMRADA